MVSVVAVAGAGPSLALRLLTAFGEQHERIISMASVQEYSVLNCIQPLHFNLNRIRLTGEDMEWLR